MIDGGGGDGDDDNGRTRRPTWRTVNEAINYHQTIRQPTILVGRKASCEDRGVCVWVWPTGRNDDLMRCVMVGNR